MYNYFFILFTSFIFSQKTTLKVFSIDERTPVESVLIYSDKKLLGETNNRGELQIDLDFISIKIVKENFVDVEFEKDALQELNWTVYLDPIKLIEIERVLVTNVKEDLFSILDKIEVSRFKQNFVRYKYYQSKVLFKASNTTLFYFNNVIYPSKGLKVNDNNEIIYLGKRNQKLNENSFFELFKFSGKECILPVTSSVFCSLGDYSITPVFDKKLYDYILESNDEFYVLKFKPKKKKPVLLYDGYFVIDKYDFGILELNMNLYKSENNIYYTNSYDAKLKYAYHVSNDAFNFKFQKKGNEYFLENSSRHIICKQIKGNHVNTEFSFSFYNEQTVNQEGLKFREFDFINNKFKE
jgi:hypothetical protein